MSLLVSSDCASFSESTVAPFHLPPSRTRNSSQMHPQSPLTASFGASLSSSTTVSTQHSWHLCAALGGCEGQAKQEVERLHRDCA
ncbi:hypothetical protein FIBSPDRAFT_872783, partial [Athelia psychrophila]